MQGRHLLALAAIALAGLWIRGDVLLDSYQPATAAAATASCHAPACWHRVHAARRHRWCARHPSCEWRQRWRRLPAAGRSWTRCVSWQESRNHRVARASGFESYFQWTADTWHRAGGQGNAEAASWAEQAVRAWRWHRAHPHGQWPNTGENGRCGG